MRESHLVSQALEFVELQLRNVADDRQMIGRRPQILADREDVDLVRSQIAHHLFRFVGFLAQPEHQPGFGRHRRAQAFGMLQHVERPFVARAYTHLPVQPRYSFDVVIQHVRLGIHYDFHSFVRALKIRHQHFYFASGNPLADGPDGQREQLRAAVFAIVTIHAGDHGILKPHRARLRRHGAARRNPPSWAALFAPRRIRSGACRRCPGS